MKSVLVVSDFFVGGGLETRILEQVKFYQQRGVKCYLAVDQYNEKLMEEFDGVLQLPLQAHDRKTIVANVDKMVEFCREKEVEMIDTQPLYGVIVASFASAVLQVPMSYTLHGKYSTPPADDSLLSWFHIALALRQPQMVLVAEYLKDYYPELLRGKEVRVVRNGVILPEKTARKTAGRKWVFASRLSAEKAKLLIEAIPVLEKAGVEQLDVFGAGENESQVREFAESFNANTTHKMKVKLCGWCDSVAHEVLSGDYEGGIGMDRVAMEMMSTGLPVMILGYEGLTEGVSRENFESSMADNFASWKKLPEAEMLQNFKRMRGNPEKYNMREMVAKELDSSQIWAERLKEVEKMKPDVGADAMVMAVWQDFYENEGKTREIERLRGQLEKTLPGRVRKALSRLRS